MLATSFAAAPSGGEYDVQLSVTHKLDNGEMVCELFPKLPSRFAAGALNELAATGRVKATSKPTVVPLSDTDGMPKVRVEFLEATKWRVRGVTGDEISRDHKSEADALKYMQRYLDQMNLTLPSEAEIDAKKAEIQAKRDGTWIEPEAEAKVAGKKR